MLLPNCQRKKSTFFTALLYNELTPYQIEAKVLYIIAEDNGHTLPGKKKSKTIRRRARGSGILDVQKKRKLVKRISYFCVANERIKQPMEATEFPVGRLLNGDSYKTQTRMKNISSAMNWIHKQLVRKSID